MATKVLGLDGCRAGWICAVVEGGRLSNVEFQSSASEVLNAHSDARVCAIDIPVELTESGRRDADAGARKMLGRRRGCVFNALPRAALENGITIEKASAAAKKCDGPGINLYSWGLVDKIRQVAKQAPDPRIHEAHPEVSFCEMARQKGKIVCWSKKTWNGLIERRSLLEEHGLGVPDCIAAGEFPPDDIVDAVACAWSALRIARSDASALGSEGSGVIWF